MKTYLLIALLMLSAGILFGASAGIVVDHKIMVSAYPVALVAILVGIVLGGWFMFPAQH